MTSSTVVVGAVELLCCMLPRLYNKCNLKVYLEHFISKFDVFLLYWESQFAVDIDVFLCPFDFE